MHTLYTRESREQQSLGKFVNIIYYIRIIIINICLSLLLPFQLLVSGGVDSSVCAALLRRALHPSQIIAVHVDNGRL